MLASTNRSDQTSNFSFVSFW